MRKQLFWAALAAMALTSCMEEKSFNGGSAGSNEVAFVMQGNATRSAEEASPATKKGDVIPIAKLDGLQLFLEEEVMDLNDVSPETRGIPIYTENVGYLYANSLFVRAGTVDATYARILDGPTPEGWRYNHTYESNIWPDSNPLDFYLHIPSDMSAAGVTGLSYNNGVTTVKYTSPVTASATQDLIFAGLKMSESQYKEYYKTKGGAPVMFYHAFTGVKFAIKNTVTELANIQIDKISFIGLNNTGSFTFTTSTHAFALNSDIEAEEGNVISQEFAPGDLITFEADDEDQVANHFAGSFYNGGNKQNLNKKDASYTFWLLPQVIDGESTAKLKIEYTINSQPEEIELNLSDFHAQNWLSGELRTFTFRIDEVNVRIQDDVVTQGNADNGYKGSYKENVTITNTGNTKAFIRAALVGQWLDYLDRPVFGFTDKINNLYLVESWYQDQFVTKNRNHGTFLNLAGYDQTNPYNGWTLCEDGYYYYTSVVPPLSDAPTQPALANTKALFTSYTVGDIPNTSLAGLEINTTMHFRLEIATQAVTAIRLDGTQYTWDEAWENATGSKPVIKK